MHLCIDGGLEMDHCGLGATRGISYSDVVDPGHQCQDLTEQARALGLDLQEHWSDEYTSTII